MLAASIETLATSKENNDSRILSVKNLCKNFGGVKALQGVNFDLVKGETHALVGENGAGKSTLTKILTGVYHYDDGDIILKDNIYKPNSPKSAKQSGIQVVHQEFNLLTYLSIAENICFESLPKTKLGTLDKKKMHQRARLAMDTVGLGDIEVTTKISELGIAHRQLVEIARALEFKSDILILDEPTATLTQREVEKLFTILEKIKHSGVTVVFISHHLNEVFNICDRVTIFRNGKTITTKEIKDTNPQDVVSLMVGKALEQVMAQQSNQKHFGSIALEVKNLVIPQSPNAEGINFCVRKGEIVGIAGLVGAGRTEILRTIFALQEKISGQVLIDGLPVEFKNPRDAVNARLAFVTEDRKDEGLILDMSIATNSSLASISQVSNAGLMDFEKENQLAADFAKKLGLRFGKLKDNVASLSGGNQQKVVLAKWLSTNPKLLMLDEPTRGVDVGAKAEIYSILRSLALDGMALIVVSSELPELMTLCDRILVLSNHQVTGELEQQSFSQEEILQLAYKNM
ncbi:sugar ABC transporter ATP-binding protein [Alginatibacterium sediminis]|uniref:Sugar ABC transporter ATP-binding protein n=1 Tax=Alginatibacterium sediminis TaxID=2164068 RepID=A0A420EI31_9ALTE|nr:sugar ABC transporter ATP-binding protein [Alginatibacterium sediminis]RKF20314.1 sugar ABC transporter ATP-binding protein [Alginatibacterium sediminis]